ncbi:hypothetical protein ACJX0J_025964, partial [Zea mays]
MTLDVRKVRLAAPPPFTAVAGKKFKGQAGLVSKKTRHTIWTTTYPKINILEFIFHVDIKKQNPVQVVLDGRFLVVYWLDLFREIESSAHYSPKLTNSQWNKNLENDIYVGGEFREEEEKYTPLKKVKTVP